MFPLVQAVIEVAPLKQDTFGLVGLPVVVTVPPPPLPQLPGVHLLVVEFHTGQLPLAMPLSVQSERLLVLIGQICEVHM